MDNKPTSVTLLLGATGIATSSASLREINGQIVPFGPVGYSSMGPITFGAGDIEIPDKPGRVKFLKQHDPERVLGYGKTFNEHNGGIDGVFSIPPSPEGDLALQEAADGRRDGLSVGVRLSQETIDEIWRKMMEGDNSPTPAAGVLMEVSQVSLPAFADARIPDSAAASNSSLVTLAVSFDPAAKPAPIKEKVMTVENSAPTLATSAEVSAVVKNDDAVNPPFTPPAAYAGNALVVTEAPVYTFDGNGPSFVRDVFNARFKYDFEAMNRLEKLNSMMGSNPAQMGMLLAAVDTRSTLPNFINNGYRPELLVDAIDKGRPLVSRLGTVPITDATPFRVPAENDFTKNTTVADGTTTSGSANISSPTIAFTQNDVGMPITGAGIPANTTIITVSSATAAVISKNATATAAGTASLTVWRSGIQDHTEGQSAAAEGQLTIGDVTITPGAVSGAYRLSREVVDASNPALDQVALRAMLRDYRKVTEKKVVAALVAASGTAIGLQDKVMEVRAQLNAFYDLQDEPASFFALSTSYYTTLLADVDTAGRPFLASVNPQNSVGDASPGWTGANIDGVEFVKSGHISANTGFIVNSADVLVAESSVQTFRFDEVEGPGIVKLALFAYFASKVLRGISVQQLASV